MKLVDLVKALIQKAGIPDTDADIAALLADANIANVEIADAKANLINNSLMNLSAAKNHPDVRKELINIGRAEAFNGMDDEIKATMGELGIADDVKAKILEEKSTTKRASLLAKEVKRLEAEGKGADKTALTQQINDLNRQIGDIQRQAADNLAKKEEEYNQRYLAQSIDFDLAGFNYIFPKETPTATKLAAARASINRSLAEKGAKVVLDAAGNKKVVRADGTDYYDETHKPVSYNDFITGALAHDNLLTASEDPADPGTHKTPTPQRVPGNPDKVDHNFLRSADADLANLEGALKRDGDKLN